jgi:hypothetical protein
MEHLFVSMPAGAAGDGTIAQYESGGALTHVARKGLHLDPGAPSRHIQQ